MQPPMACRIRKKIRLLTDQEAPHRSDPAMNSTSEVIHIVFPPNRRTAHPVSGIVIARASVYAVSTHWMVESEVWKSRPSVLIATFTIVVSRIVMIAPRTTTTASRRSSGSKVAGGRPDVPVSVVIYPSPGSYGVAVDRYGVRVGSIA